jgi:hypothetical protein
MFKRKKVKKKVSFRGCGSSSSWRWEGSKG